MTNLIAVVSALADEVRPITSRMTFDLRVHKRPMFMQRGTYGVRPVVFLRSGIGRDLMSTACAELLSSMKPSVAIHVGYCGACDPRLLVGDFVVAEFVACEDSGEKIDCDMALSDLAFQTCKEAGLRGLQGGIVTVDRVVAHSHDKAFMGTSFNALALDMESFAFASAMRSAQVPFIVARTVLDQVDVELPDLGSAIDNEGDVDKLALVEKIMKHPKQAMSVPKIGYMASQARNSIATFLDKILSKEIK